jgi:hypothetical protein
MTDFDRSNEAPPLYVIPLLLCLFAKDWIVRVWRKVAQ